MSWPQLDAWLWNHMKMLILLTYCQESPQTFTFQVGPTLKISRLVKVPHVGSKYGPSNIEICGMSCWDICKCASSIVRFAFSMNAVVNICLEQNIWGLGSGGLSSVIPCGDSSRCLVDDLVFKATDESYPGWLEKRQYGIRYRNMWLSPNERKNRW